MLSYQIQTVCLSEVTTTVTADQCYEIKYEWRAFTNRKTSDDSPDETAFREYLT